MQLMKHHVESSLIGYEAIERTAFKIVKYFVQSLN